MKTNLFVLVYFLCSMNYTFGQCPVPKIISPNGSEQLFAGDTYTVEYYYKDSLAFDWDWVLDFIDFSYSADNGQNWKFVDSIAVDSVLAVADSLLRFEWKVPMDISDSCKIKLVKYDTFCWDESDDVFRISNSTSTSHLTDEALVIHPNPVQYGNNIIVSNMKDDLTRVDLYDLSGEIRKTILVDSNDQIEIETDHLGPGIYILSLSGGSRTVSRTIVIK